MKKIDRKLDLHKLKDDIISWIRSYCDHNKLESLIVGVSGGVDSALVSTLCASTGIDCYLVILPLYQNNEHTIRGENHIEWLKSKFTNIHKIKIDVSSIFDTFQTTIPEEFHNSLSSANTKSRIRMTMLYHIAQSKNGIVVGTGNKVEDFGIGFFTKYGDGGVDISPIADLYKSEVYKMSKNLGIAEEILHAAPTDGLWEDGRDDKTQIGASYDELEWCMEFAHLTDINNLDNYDAKIISIYNNLNSKNKHKMVGIPTFKIQ